MAAMLFKNPATMYAGCAGIMFLLYTSIETYAGTLSGAGTKCILSSWCIISLIVTSFMMSILTAKETSLVDPQTELIMYIVCILTLTISCIMLKCAW